MTISMRRVLPGVLGALAAAIGGPIPAEAQAASDGVVKIEALPGTIVRWSTQNAGDFGTVVHLDRHTGVMKLDGVDGSDNQDPNAWIFRSVTIPAQATSLDLDVSAHDRAGANALYRVRLEDGGGSHTLIDWTEKSGIEGSLTFSMVHADLTPWAGQTVTLFLEQDGNAPGAHEQIYYDDVWIH